MSEHDRLTTITTAQFVEQDYPAKIAAGECEVLHQNIYSLIRVDHDYPNQRDFWAVDTTHKTFQLKGTDTLSVRWLTTDAPASPPAPESGAGEVVSGSMPENELIDKILHTLGVDPGDWASSLSGIYAAVRSNMQIGEPQMSTIEDWTDAAEISEDTLTAIMFKLVEQRLKAEAECDNLQRQLAQARAEVARLRDLLHSTDYETSKVLAQHLYNNQATPATPPAVDPAVAVDALAALVAACEPFAELWELYQQYTKDISPDLPNTLIQYIWDCVIPLEFYRNWQKLVNAAAALAAVKGAVS